MGHWDKLGQVVGVVVEVFFWCVVVAAAAFVVAAAYGFVEGCASFVDVEGEAAFASAFGAAVPGCDAGVFLEVVAVLCHCCLVLIIRSTFDLLSPVMAAISLTVLPWERSSVTFFCSWLMSLSVCSRRWADSLENSRNSKWT